MTKQTRVKIGDWVESYSPGIWRVYDILDDFYELRYRLDKEKRRTRTILVFSKRLVDERWKKAFKGEACDIAGVRVLGEAEMAEIQRYLAANPNLMSEFEAHDVDREFVFRVVDVVPC